MTVIRPEPANTRSVEPKVKWATIGSYVVGVVAVGIVNALTGNDNELLIEALPDAAEAFVLPIVPAVSAFVFGWYAKHQWRVRPNAQGGASGSTEVG
jgi:hypothetical protein